LWRRPAALSLMLLFLSAVALVALQLESLLRGAPLTGPSLGAMAAVLVLLWVLAVLLVVLILLVLSLR